MFVIDEEIRQVFSDTSERIKRKPKSDKIAAIQHLDKYLEREDVKNHPCYDMICLFVTYAQREIRKQVLDDAEYS